jgi:tRNA (Thr-GGU) A37 N-methylase
VVRGARHPRDNPAWPRVGIFAQRGKNRPNRLGTTMVEIVKREGRTLEVLGLDAADGTMVVDIKPVFKEFLPRTQVRQPQWTTELMRDYW